MLFRSSNRTRTDIIFDGGVIRYRLKNDKIQHEYVRNYTDLPFIVREDFNFDDGLYSGYNEKTRKYDQSSWDYELGDDGYAKVDPTLQHPRSVYKLLKKHYERYNPAMVDRKSVVEGKGVEVRLRMGDLR